MRRLKSVKEKKEQPGILRPRELRSGDFPGFSFCLIYPRLGTDDDGSPEASMVQIFLGEKISTLSSQRTGKGIC